MISVVCPVYNEEKYIAQLLSFFEQAKPEEKELIIVDGLSTDRTREIVEQYVKRNASIRMVDNPQQFVPFALNKAIKECKGEYIIRLDAHSKYSADYFESVLNVFTESGADIVGGPMRAIGDTPFQKAVAHATSTSLGIGNSNFHFESFRGFTDSVYLGAWKRSVFQKVGFFDERMLRNQDDEFHYRAKQAGLKIFQDPSIRSWYYPRSNWGTLFRQYEGYGKFKPLVLRKIRSEAKIRHIIPIGFLLYLITLPLLIVVHWISLLPLALYIFLVVAFSFRSDHAVSVKLRCLVVYPTLHIAYGWGFLQGLFKST